MVVGQVVGQPAVEVEQLLRKVVDAQRARSVDQRPRRATVGPRRASDAEVDAAGNCVVIVRKFSATLSEL